MSFMTLGVVLLAFGLPVTTRALLLMYDATSTTQVWMLKEFGAGLCAVGWGIAVVLPAKGRRLGMTMMALGTVGIWASVVILSQGMPA